MLFPPIDAFEKTSMNPDIEIIRDGEKYRLLHGHLRLFSMLRDCEEIRIDVRGEGPVTIRRQRADYIVGKDGQRLPLIRN
jgi:hypothetical protein